MTVECRAHIWIKRWKKLLGLKESSHGHEYYFRLKRFKIPKLQFLQRPLEADSKGELLWILQKCPKSWVFFILMVTFWSPFHTITGKQNLIHHYARRHPHIKFSIAYPDSASFTFSHTQDHHQQSSVFLTRCKTQQKSIIPRHVSLNPFWRQPVISADTRAFLLSQPSVR